MHVSSCSHRASQAAKPTLLPNLNDACSKPSAPRHPPVPTLLNFTIVGSVVVAVVVVAIIVVVVAAMVVVVIGAVVTGAVVVDGAVVTRVMLLQTTFSPFSALPRISKSWSWHRSSPSSTLTSSMPVHCSSCSHCASHAVKLIELLLMILYEANSWRASGSAAELFLEHRSFLLIHLQFDV